MDDFVQNGVQSGMRGELCGEGHEKKRFQLADS